MEPVRVELKDNLVMYSMPPPGSGVLAAYILNTLDIFAQESQARTSDTEPLTYHRIAEAFKHAYAQRTKLADPRFEPQVTEVNKFARLEREREIISLLKKKIIGKLGFFFLQIILVGKEFDIRGMG